jgi:antitoxin (DNA-binding transcriptional repressor) of toxin-antitoxin stability system
MQTITIEELHAHTGEWISRAAQEDEITVTDGGKALVVIRGVVAGPQPGHNPFHERKLVPGYAELQGRLVGGTDSTLIISEDREGR